MVSKESRSKIRAKKHMRIRNRFSGTAERPRLAVFRSNNHVYAQVIDDVAGKTIVSASTLEKDIKAELKNTDDIDAASKVGSVVAQRAMEKGIIYGTGVYKPGEIRNSHAFSEAYEMGKSVK